MCPLNKTTLGRSRYLDWGTDCISKQRFSECRGRKASRTGRTVSVLYHLSTWPQEHHRRWWSSVGIWSRFSISHPPPLLLRVCTEEGAFLIWLPADSIAEISSGCKQEESRHLCLSRHCLRMLPKVAQPGTPGRFLCSPKCLGCPSATLRCHSF